MEREDYGWGDSCNPIHAIYWCEDCGFEIMWIKNVRKGRSHLRVLYDPRVDNRLDLANPNQDYGFNTPDEEP